MAAGIELATAWVRIVPTTKNIGEDISNALNQEAKPAGKKAGEESGKSFADSFGAKLKEAGKKTEEIGKSISQNVSLPIAAGFTAAMASWAQVDSGFDTVIQKTGATGEALKEMQDSVQKIATTIPTSFQNAGIAVGEVNTRFGLTGKALEDTSKQFLQFAKINGTDLNTSIDTVQKAMSAFSLSADDAGAVLDTLNKVGQDTGISMEVLEQNLVTNATALQGMGLNIASSARLLGQLEKSGVDVQTVMMGMKKVQANAMSEGISMQEAFQKALSSTTGAIDVFGTKAGPQLYQSFLNGSISADMFADSNASLSDSIGSVENTANAMQDPAEQWQTTLNSLMMLGYEIGNSVMPIISQAVETLTPMIKDLADKWSELSPETQDLIIKAGLLAAAAGPVLSIGGKLIGGFGSLTSWVGGLITPVSDAAGSLADIGSKAGSAASGVSGASTSFGQLAGQALSLVALGAGIALAGVGIKQVADAAVEVAAAGPGAGIAMGLMIVSIAGLAVGAAMLGPSLTAGAVGFLAFGAAVLLTGVGVKLTASGMEKLAKALPTIASSGGAAAVALLQISGSAVTGSAAAIALGAGLTTMSLGMGAVTLASVLFNPAFKEMTENFTKMSSAFPDIQSGMTVLDASITMMTAHLNKENTRIGTIMDAMKKKIIDSINEISRKFSDTQFKFNRNIKLPHFTMHGSFNAETGETPSVGVKWYRKAMNTLILLDGATIFGISGKSLLGGGEAGREIVMSEEYLKSLKEDSRDEGEPRNHEGMVQNLYIYSTEPLTPSEVARQSRNAGQQMVLEMMR